MLSLFGRKRTSAAPIEFALDLAADAVVLYERGAVSGWKKFASADLDDPEFPIVIGLLRNEAEKHAGGRHPVRLWLPPGQVLRRRAEIHGASEADRLKAGFDFVRLQTVYRPEDVAIAVAPQARNGKTTLLITFAETWQEARDYAERWGFLPGEISTRSQAADFGVEGPSFKVQNQPAERAASSGRAPMLVAASVALAVTGAVAWAFHDDVTSLVSRWTGPEMAQSAGEGGTGGGDASSGTLLAAAGQDLQAPQQEVAPQPEAAPIQTGTVTAQDRARETPPAETDAVPGDTTGQPSLPARITAETMAGTLAETGQNAGLPGDQPAGLTTKRIDPSAPAHVATVPALPDTRSQTAAPEVGDGLVVFAAAQQPGLLADSGPGLNPPNRPPSPGLPDRKSGAAGSWADIPGLKSPGESMPRLAALDLAKSRAGSAAHEAELELLGRTGPLGKLPLPVPRIGTATLVTAAPGEAEPGPPDQPPRVVTGPESVPAIAPEPRDMLAAAPLAAENLRPDTTELAVAVSRLPRAKPTAEIAEPGPLPAAAALAPVAAEPAAQDSPVLALADDAPWTFAVPEPPLDPPLIPLSEAPEPSVEHQSLEPTELAIEAAPAPPVRPWPDPAKAEAAVAEAAEAADTTEPTGPADLETAETDDESLAPTGLAVETSAPPPVRPWPDPAEAVAEAQSESETESGAEVAAEATEGPDEAVPGGPERVALAGVEDTSLAPTAHAVESAPLPPTRPGSNLPEPEVAEAPADLETEAPAAPSAAAVALAEGADDRPRNAAPGGLTDPAPVDDAVAPELAGTGAEDLTPTENAVAEAPRPPRRPGSDLPEPAIAGAPADLETGAPAAPGAAAVALAGEADSRPNGAVPGGLADPAPVGDAVAPELAGTGEEDLTPTENAVAEAPQPPRRPGGETASTGETGATSETGPTSETGDAADIAEPDEAATETAAAEAADTEAGDTVSGDIGTGDSETADAADQSGEDAAPQVTVFADLAGLPEGLPAPKARPREIFASADGTVRSLADIQPSPRPAHLTRRAETESAADETVAATADPPAAEVTPTPGIAPVTIVGTAPRSDVGTAEAREQPAEVSPDALTSGLLPDDAQAAPADPDAPTEYASLTAPLPSARPLKPALPRAAAPSTIKLPEFTPKTVKEAATDQGMPLDRIALIGILEIEGGRKALLRLPNGRYRSVINGDVLDGWRVSAIGKDAMRVSRSGEDRTLLLVNR